jgi:hypothetical protein
MSCHFNVSSTSRTRTSPSLSSTSPLSLPPLYCVLLSRSLLPLYCLRLARSLSLSLARALFHAYMLLMTQLLCLLLWRSLPVSPQLSRVSRAYLALTSVPPPRLPPRVDSLLTAAYTPMPMPMHTHVHARSRARIRTCSVSPAATSARANRVCVRVCARASVGCLSVCLFQLRATPAPNPLHLCEAPVSPRFVCLLVTAYSIPHPPYHIFHTVPSRVYASKRIQSGYSTLAPLHLRPAP